MKVVKTILLLCIPLWWIFTMLWNPGVVLWVSELSYRFAPPSISVSVIEEARSRALRIVTDGLSGNQDVIFTPNELSHLEDVHRVYLPVSRILNFLSACSWILLLAFLLSKRSIHANMKTAALAYGLVVTLFILCLVFFSSFFTQFHELLFPQGNWQFEETSVLIQTFPEPFWKLTLLLIGFLCSVVAVIYWLLFTLFTQDKPDELAR